MTNCGISDGKLQKGGRWKMEILFTYEWVNWGKNFLLSLSFCLFLPIFAYSLILKSNNQ